MSTRADWRNKVESDIVNPWSYYYGSPWQHSELDRQIRDRAIRDAQIRDATNLRTSDGLRRLGEIQSETCQSIAEDATGLAKTAINFNAMAFGGGFTRTTLTTPNNYRSVFQKAQPNLPSSHVIHHSLPQRYRELMRQSKVYIDELQYLRGVDPEIHGRITKEWLGFHGRCGGDPSAVQVLNFADEINERYGQYFIAPEF